MKKYIYSILAGLMLASCVDTTLLPDDKTVDEDFWKNKSDVALMVNGAYAQMLNADVIRSLIIWGDFRSDEMTRVSSITGGLMDDLAEIEMFKIETDNQFNNWASIYNVINYCNIVIKKAEPVVQIDPSYTEGDFESDKAQMLALRSLCYFYLVRNFRDVVYNTEAFLESSQNMDIPQTDPLTVLKNCIADLEWARTRTFSPLAFNDWKRVGWINVEGVDAILADINLWLGSVTHDKTYYDECIKYCNNVIASKNNYAPENSNVVDEREYQLAEYSRAYKDVFVTGNSRESIFELQFNGENNSNSAILQYLYAYNSQSSASSGYLKASRIFDASNLGSSLVWTNKTSDNRPYEFVYDSKSSNESYDVRKMIADHQKYSDSPVGGSSEVRTKDFPLSKVGVNYIVYRLSDIMLMKAEAMVASYTEPVVNEGEETPVDYTLQQAFNLVQYVNSRSLYNVGNDSLKWNDYKTTDQMEKLVLAERLRELCFEGKRWYDLLRYNYRHVEGTDYTKILADQTTIPGVFRDFADLVARKASMPANIIAKLTSEAYLYMPILQSQIEVCPAIKQNPVYSASDVWEKNY